MGKKDIIDFSKLIEPAVLDNYIYSDDTGKTVKADSSFQTKDYVYIRDSIRPFIVNNIHPSDYAMLCGANIAKFRSGFRHLAVSNEVFRRPTKSYGSDAVAVSMFETKIGEDYRGVIPSVKDYCIRPCMHLNLDYFSELMLNPDHLNFELVKDDEGEVRYRTIELGSYPQSVANTWMQRRLEKMHKLGKMGGDYLLNAKKRFFAHREPFLGDVSYGNEYHDYSFLKTGSKLNGKYVRFESVCTSGKYLFHLEPAATPDRTTYWCKIEPIKWIIMNWVDLPTDINPLGRGTAKYVEVMTEDGIISGMPFHTLNYGENVNLWQNSMIRGFLNGINVNNIKFNGNPDFGRFGGGDFSVRENFLQAAFGLDATMMREKLGFDEKTFTSKIEESVSDQQEEVVDFSENLYGVTIDDDPMSIDDQIKFYVDNGMSFMFHGPSGVGKSRRVEEMDPNYVSIVLRNGILPEEVIGKTIYRNDDSIGGKWMPPAWYDELCTKCEKEPDKKHILFIDEITNVKPSEQSLVYHIVLKNSIGPNLGKLPDNVVVVAAGNSKDESESAYVMPEPLFRRFDGHIYLKPDIQHFIEWGSEKSDKGEGRLKIHPFISAFVGMNASKVFYSKYDNDNPPEYAIDPRGWEQISDLIYDNDGVICKELIENKAGPEIAASLMEFARNPLITLNDVLNYNYTIKDIPKSFDGKYALAVGLRSVDEGNIGTVRDFIAKCLGSEILAMFESLWIGNSDERALIIDSLHLSDISDSKGGR